VKPSRDGVIDPAWASFHLTLKISGGHTFCSLFRDDWTRPLNLDVGLPQLKGYSNELQLMYKHFQEFGVSVSYV